MLINCHSKGSLECRSQLPAKGGVGVGPMLWLRSVWRVKETEQTDKHIWISEDKQDTILRGSKHVLFTWGGGGVRNYYYLFGCLPVPPSSPGIFGNKQLLHKSIIFPAMEINSLKSCLANSYHSEWGWGNETIHTEIKWNIQWSQLSEITL